MTISERIFNYLENNFDGRLMLEIDGKFEVFNNNEDILLVLVNRFDMWAFGNEDPNYQDPIKLWEYCMITHNFGAICTLYYEDSSGDFCRDIPYEI